MASFIVVGGGLAGLVAARDLKELGHEVKLFEARDRLGGRTWYHPFADIRPSVELGGGWFSLDQMIPMQSEIERYGLRPTEEAMPEAVVWYTGGVRRSGLPIPAEEGFALERCIFSALQAFSMLEETTPDGRSDLAALDISVGQWLDDLAAPTATRDFISAWVTMYCGCSPNEVSLIFLGHAMACFGPSVFALFAGLAQKVEGGTGRLVDALADDVGRENIELGNPVAAISSDADRARVTLASGYGYEADGLVVAVPINTLGRISFEPVLPQSMRTIIEQGQPCRSIKFWALVKGVPRGFFAAGYGGGAQWIVWQDEWDGRALLVGFGQEGGTLDPSSIASVQQAIRVYAPDAIVETVGHHDWNADPWSNGGWMVTRPGWFTSGALTPFRAVHGRMVFAGSDVSDRYMAWMAGALHSGRAAAKAIVESLVDCRLEIGPAKKSISD